MTAKIPISVSRKVIKYGKLSIEYGPPSLALVGALRHAFGPSLGVSPRELKPLIKYVREEFRGETPLKSIYGIIYVVSKIKPSLAPGFKAVKGSEEHIHDLVKVILNVARYADTFTLPYLVVIQVPTLYAQTITFTSVIAPSDMVVPGLRFCRLCSKLEWGEVCYVVDGERVVNIDEFLGRGEDGLPKVRVTYEVGAVVADTDLLTIAYAFNISNIYSLLGAHSLDVRKSLSRVISIEGEETDKHPLAFIKKLSKVIRRGKE